MDRLKISKTYKLYIDGAFPRTESGRYYSLHNQKGDSIANVCLSSVKDVRNAVQSARRAFNRWSQFTPFHRSQILYRMAEILEGRRDQFISEIMIQGGANASKEVDLSIDRIVYYAGWCDKYQQVLSSINPVSSAHFNFSFLEPMGVIGVFPPEDTSLLGLVSAILPLIAGGNTCVVLACEKLPLSSITFAEVMHSSDLPAGVVNIITGSQKELGDTISQHLDVNAIWYGDQNQEMKYKIEKNASLNVKRVAIYDKPWCTSEGQDLYMISDFQEIKTTWHPIEKVGGFNQSY